MRNSSSSAPAGVQVVGVVVQLSRLGARQRCDQHDKIDMP
jgi:hypothetical protein